VDQDESSNEGITKKHRQEIVICRFICGFFCRYFRASHDVEKKLVR
jgi:hypothetical protein